MKKYTEEQIIKAIAKSDGTVSNVARKLKCDWHTARSYIDKYPSAKEALKTEKESIIDLAESVIFDALRNGDTQTAKWVLSTIGKKRGYTERQEITGADGDPLLPPKFVRKPAEVKPNDSSTEK